MTRIILTPGAAVAMLFLGACAENYAVEGAAVGAAAGAAVGAATDLDDETSAAVGAAAGGAVGSQVEKEGDCDPDEFGEIDEDCYDPDR